MSKIALALVTFFAAVGSAQEVEEQFCPGLETEEVVAGVVAEEEEELLEDELEEVAQSDEVADASEVEEDAAEL